MSFTLPHAIEQADRCRSFFDRLQQIYAQMDEVYRKAADQYGFECRGCADNCCRTRFYHHTLLEYLYIADGWQKLDVKQRIAIAERAAEVRKKTDAALAGGESVRLMCPLNVEGRCVLYGNRPMICRLHGLPHELRRPGMQPSYGPGCGDFTERCGAKAYIPLDRTPHYFHLAQLEKELRRFSGLDHKIKKTVAEMLAHEID